jgi:photosystem II stability/assembly factor-like uncharacterized protein
MRSAKGAFMRNVKIFMGLLWCLSMSGSFAYQSFHGCALASDNATGWVVTQDSMIILKTTDGGANWFEQANPADRRFFDVACFGNQKAWTCGILGQICYTSDGGQNWAIQLAGGGAKYATRVEFFDADHGWTVCGDGVVMRTTDGGVNWEVNFTPFIFLPELYGVSFCDTLRGWIVSGWPDSLDVGQAVVARSTDGGVIWDSLFQCSNNDDYFDVHFFDAQNGIIAGGNEQNYAALILRSTDGGASWNQMPVPGNAFYLRALDFVGGQGWAVGRFGTIIHSHDYGQTWVYQTNPATTTLFDIDFSDTLHGIVCGTSIILYTYDGGETWHDGTGIVENSSVRTGDGCLRACPNPFSENLTIKYQIPNAKCQMNVQSQISIRIYNTAGRFIKQFNHLTVQPFNPIIWDGFDDAGHPVPAGVYFIRLTGFGKTETAKVILER